MVNLGGGCAGLELPNTSHSRMPVLLKLSTIVYFADHHRHPCFSQFAGGSCFVVGQLAGVWRCLHYTVSFLSDFAGALMNFPTTSMV
nr:hypothetical protein Itr_chr13CG18140 [Ipomoea trifida]